jgi:hypothetical protein
VYVLPGIADSFSIPGPPASDAIQPANNNTHCTIRWHFINIPPFLIFSVHCIGGNKLDYLIISGVIFDNNFCTRMCRGKA